MEKKQTMTYRSHGKYFEQYMQFIEQVAKGKTVEVHGPGYIVMNRKRYEQLLSRAYPTDIRIEGSD